MYVKNSRFDPAKPSPDNPRFWVGRIAEIMRGGRVRLHWHRETALGSGLVVPTNNYFPERAALLQSFRAVIFDPTRKAWCTYPALERDTVEEAAVLAAKAVKAAALAAAAAAAAPAVGAAETQTTLAVGSFIFLRNARFRVETESPLLPRYWVARVTGITMQDPAAASGGDSGASSAGTMLVNGVQTPVRVGGGTAATAGGGNTLLPPAAHALMTPDGRLRLQWHRETAPLSGLYVSTEHIFFEHKRLTELVPGLMQWDARESVWRRIVNGSSGPPPPLCFPGDEALIAPIAASAAEAAAAKAAAAAAAAEVAASGRLPLDPGAFAFVPNTKYKAGTAETQACPRNWVARLLGVQPPKVPGAPAVAKVQWHAELAPGAGLFRQSPRTFMEAVSALRPLPGMVYDATASAWRLVGGYDYEGRFQEPPAPPPRADTAAATTTGGVNGGSSSSLPSRLRLSLAEVEGLSDRPRGPLYALLRFKGNTLHSAATTLQIREGGSPVWSFVTNEVASWALPPGNAPPEGLEVELWDAGVGGQPSTDAGASAGSVHTRRGIARVDLTRALLHVPVPAAGAGAKALPPPAAISRAPLSAIDADILAALAPQRVSLSTGGSLSLRVWVEDSL